MGSKRNSGNNEFIGDKCSASCVKAGTIVLLFSLLGLSLLQQLSKQDHLEHLISYITLRYMLSEQVELLQYNPCWKNKIEEIGAEKILKLPISELLEHECTFKIKINEVKNNSTERLSQGNSQDKKKPLAPPQGLGLSTPIKQLFEISDTLKKLNESELLTLARNYNNDFNFSIFKWENLQYRLVLSNSDDTAWADWQVISSDAKREKTNLLDHLTIDDVIKLAEYEYPEWNKVESMIEKNKINIPSFSQKYRIIDASILIEIVILISIIYFWVFLVEAILSSNYPEKGTFFNAITRTMISKFYFFCLLLFPAVISILIGIKSIEYNKLNLICGIITLIFVTKIWANIFKIKQD